MTLYDMALLTCLVIQFGFGKNMWDIIPQEHITEGYKVC